jgi:hypothetical protein
LTAAVGAHIIPLTTGLARLARLGAKRRDDHIVTDIFVVHTRPAL